MCSRRRSGTEQERHVAREESVAANMVMGPCQVEEATVVLERAEAAAENPWKPRVERAAPTTEAWSGSGEAAGMVAEVAERRVRRRRRW